MLLFDCLKKALLCLTIFTTILCSACSAIDKSVIAARAIRTCLGVGRLASQIARNLTDKSSESGKKWNTWLWRTAAACEVGMALSSFVDEYSQKDDHRFKYGWLMSGITPTARGARSICETIRNGEEIEGRKTSIVANLCEFGGQLVSDWGELAFKDHAPKTRLAGDLTRIGGGLMGHVLGSKENVPELFQKNPSLFLYLAELVGPIWNHFDKKEADKNKIRKVETSSGATIIVHPNQAANQNKVFPGIPNTCPLQQACHIWSINQRRAGIEDNFSHSNEYHVAERIIDLLHLRKDPSLLLRAARLEGDTTDISQILENVGIREIFPFATGKCPKITKNECYINLDAEDLKRLKNSGSEIPSFPVQQMINQDPNWRSITVGLHHGLHFSAAEIIETQPGHFDVYPYDSLEGYSGNRGIGLCEEFINYIFDSRKKK